MTAFLVFSWLDSTSSQSNSTKDDLTDGTSNRSDENPDESLERDVPEITLVEESYDPTKAKAESRQSLNQVYIPERTFKFK